MKQLMYLTIIALLIVTIPFSYNQLNAEHGSLVVSEQQNHFSLTENKDQMSTSDESEHELSHEDIVSVMDRFMDQLVQETTEDYRVSNYDTMEQLKESFSDFASSHVTNQFVDYYYEEKDDGLYIIPTATPPWFIDGVDYEKVEVEPGHYLIKQNNETEFDGEYTIVIELQLKDGGQPYIMDIQYE
ncbi:hypothetical protein J2R98_002794 [Alkalibacillus filiformis]|uniref:Uncharacterized protein n=1 Tax=Alkalibacillus filiformis TaxID=200990 RepID=A0ABU0DWU0_9BACI|nr:hypothetical protein [Alkalibacillus filiformis]MDQ0352943.1 hypothetical protein [Alkalibacillus filiformis]